MADTDNDAVALKPSGDVDSLFAEILESDMVVIDPRSEANEPFIGSDGSPWTMTMAGPLHPVSKALDKKRMARARNRAMKGRNAPADDSDWALEECVAKVLNWTPVTIGGSEMPCDEVNKKKLFSSSPFVRDQAVSYLNEGANFLPKASKP